MGAADTHTNDAGMAGDESKRLSKERFGKYAASYVTNPTHATGPDLRRIVQIVGEHPGWDALDVATGGGHTALALAPHVAQVIATDLAPPMLVSASQFITAQGVENVDFMLADAEALPFPGERFDLVTCRIAAHHFPDPDRFVSEAARVLRPGGLFLLQDQEGLDDPDGADYIARFERRRDPSHVRALSEKEWQHILTEAGLVVASVDRFEKTIWLAKWVADQGGTDEELVALRRLLDEAPDSVKKWLRPADIEGREARFINHHLLVASRKPA
jgi:ubiquinone/menaquinone biosynthesis C-methylase UbiE